jgi:hypothetical protein
MSSLFYYIDKEDINFEEFDLFVLFLRDYIYSQTFFKGHLRKPKNVLFMSSLALYTG